jgi:aryl-alcohol dehydrogenase-like predicted oxidoreductase
LDPNASGNHRKNLLRSLDLSLTRLGTDRIDLYWVHIWDPRTPLEETMRALDDAVRAGKVLYVGISDAPAWVVSRANTLAEWHGWTPACAIQVPYSLVQREVERDLLPMARALGLSVAGWSPLAGGVLSGKFNQDSTGSSTRVSQGTISEHDLGIARVVADVAKASGATSSQVAIAWTMARHPEVHPIVGARHVDQLADNLGAVEISLSEDELGRLDQASAISLGFPHDFIAETASSVYGPVHDAIDVRRGR